MSADFGPTDIAAVDVDMDGRTELLWGAGSTTTGPDHLYVADWPARSIISQTTHLDGPFAGPEIGDLDGDGSDEMVAVTFASDEPQVDGPRATGSDRGLHGDVASGRPMHGHRARRQGARRVRAQVATATRAAGEGLDRHIAFATL